MLGETLDYWVLKGLAHRRNLATEEELNSRAGGATAQTFEAAMPKMRKLMRRFGGRLSADPAKRYLDMGCGTGELTLALARMGAGQITGVDFTPRSIETARTRRALGSPTCTSNAATYIPGTRRTSTTCCFPSTLSSTSRRRASSSRA